MRIKVEYETKREELPIEYRRKYISHLKSAFEGYNQDIFYPPLSRKQHLIKSFSGSIFFLPGSKVS